jgi:superfamily I DNA/RNA helicase
LSKKQSKKKQPVRLFQPVSDYLQRKFSNADIKGHEFDAVIILEANDSEWPSKLADNIEEERRLFYVAMTRAKKYLYFITSKEDGVSRFISEAGIQ